MAHFVVRPHGVLGRAHPRLPGGTDARPPPGERTAEAADGFGSDLLHGCSSVGARLPGRATDPADPRAAAPAPAGICGDRRRLWTARSPEHLPRDTEDQWHDPEA